VALVVVGDALDVAEPHGKHGLGAFESGKEVRNAAK